MMWRSNGSSKPDLRLPYDARRQAWRSVAAILAAISIVFAMMTLIPIAASDLADSASALENAQSQFDIGTTDSEQIAVKIESSDDDDNERADYLVSSIPVTEPYFESDGSEFDPEGANTSNVIELADTDSIALASMKGSQNPRLSAPTVVLRQ